MAKGKSLILSMEVTVAARAHPCRFNKNHKISKGMSRLTLKQDRSTVNYCMACAKKFLETDIGRLQALLIEVNTIVDTTCEVKPEVDFLLPAPWPPVNDPLGGGQ